MQQYRRYLVIKYRVGTNETGYFAGPVLVSTCDYHSFHLWDEPDAAYLDECDYQVVRVYPLGYSQTEALRRYASEFAVAWPMSLCADASSMIGEFALAIERESPTFFHSMNHPLPALTA